MNPGQSSNTNKFLPEDISQVMNAGDFPQIFDYLEKTFHISTNWRIVFTNDNAQRPKHGGTMSDAEYFCRFLKLHIEPSINTLRMREGTLFPMLRYILKDRIKKLEQHQQRYGGYYDRDGRFQKGR